MTRTGHQHPIPECANVGLQTSGYSGDKIHTGDLGLIRLDFLSGLDVLLIGLYRCRGCVGRFVCHKLDFCLANHNLGRVYWAYRAHISLLEFLQICRHSFMFP